MAKTYIACICGHETAAEGDTSAFGTENVTTMPVSDDGVDYCLECIRGMAITCGLCSQAIFIGDPVTLMIRNDGEVPKGATIYDVERRVYIGCLRASCTDTIAERAGFWLPDPDNPGYAHIQGVRSAFAAAMTSPSAVGVIPDITRP